MAKVSVRLRKGDWAWVALGVSIAAYEKAVRDDDDLLSCRVSAYRKTRVGRVLADTVILATALHLAEACPPDLDVYHWLMLWVRKAAVKADTLLTE